MLPRLTREAMKAQEAMPQQLQLDFAASDRQEGAAEPARTAVIFRLESYRPQQEASAYSLAAIYDAIHQTVKHVSSRGSLHSGDVARPRKL